MTNSNARSWLGIAARAIGTGLMMTIVLPIIALFGVLAISHLLGGCGPGSSGGCEMGAALLGLYAIPPAFMLGVCYSVYRDLRKSTS